ncbi:MAG: DUF971 domain-containing protein [Myxococcota bacterium]
MSADITPVELRAPRGARVMEIDWADGHTGTYPHEVLRGFCPCAHCQGHEGPIRFVDGGDLNLEDVQPVGNYAVRLVWGDGHQTGIYSFRYLRALSACSSSGDGDLRERSFSRQ